jgi:hypothetical protein
MSFGMGMGIGIGAMPQSAGGAASLSGVVQGSAGGYYGFTDFSEFAVAAGDITGITYRGTTADEPATRGIGTDGTEGNYHYVDATVDWLAQIYSIDGLDVGGLDLDDTDDIEVLARVYAEVNVGWGPGFGILGDGTAAGRQSFAPGKYTTTSHRLHVVLGATVANRLTIGYASQVVPLWYWIRFRLDQGPKEWKAKVWTGALGDEPGAWSATGAATDTFSSAYLGWGSGYVNTGEHRIAYFSFTQDVSGQAPPEPA